MAAKVERLSPTLSGHLLLPGRVWAAVLAAMTTLAGPAPLKAPDPPAMAETLLVAPGGHAAWHEAGVIVVGMPRITPNGEASRPVKLRFLPEA